ncbi:FixH family protein [Allobacillus sp. SKP8-2]|uniref:FixH family protein n=1 Tax=Allobacillus saliphilus TaxID=2912308 RepID=A0A941CUR3_9BACI|nr:FixH family protein [Allobacillus saliphilus]
MKRFIVLTLLVLVLAACSSNDKEEEKEHANHSNESDELTALEVEVDIPEQVEVGETVELKALVTYGEEDVTDAEEMNFEYWKKGNKDNSETVETTNNGDGSYTVEVTFEEKGVYEMFAHTTAKGQHNMPQASITVGDVEE